MVGARGSSESGLLEVFAWTSGSCRVALGQDSPSTLRVPPPPIRTGLFEEAPQRTPVAPFCALYRPAAGGTAAAPADLLALLARGERTLTVSAAQTPANDADASSFPHGTTDSLFPLPGDAYSSSTPCVVTGGVLAPRRLMSLRLLSHSRAEVPSPRLVVVTIFSAGRFWSLVARGFLDSRVRGQYHWKHARIHSCLIYLFTYSFTYLLICLFSYSVTVVI